MTPKVPTLRVYPPSTRMEEATNLASVTKLLATKARNALWLQFFVMGVVSMAWVPRIPEIKTANELSDTQFGLVLIASSIGAVLVSGRLISGVGSS